MKKISLIIALLFLFIACQKEKVDLIIINSNTYTVNDSFDIAAAFAIKDGKFLAVGSNAEIQEKYQSDNLIDAKNQTIVPGLIDAHCHFYRMGLDQQKVSLEGTKSYNEVLERLVAFQKEKNVNFITGRGWDQNDWEIKEFPTKEKLDELFPTIPVAIRRVDGHALLVNQATIDAAGI
ncbi:MAG: amidohydrolase family protein, partial [Polaribacter sp.]|nr:amidohydrolase family protein [Polaribacter sp.]